MLSITLFACGAKNESEKDDFDQPSGAFSTADNEADAPVSEEKTASKEANATSSGGNKGTTSKTPTKADDKKKDSTSGEKTASEEVKSNTGKGNKETNSEPSAKHEHSYSSKVIKAVTCEEDGTMEYRCSCGDSYTEAIQTTGHQWNKTSCTEPRTCQACGYTESVALGHYFFNGSITCLNCGYTMPFSFTGNMGSELEFKNMVSQFGDQVLARINIDVIYLNESQDYVFIQCTPTYVMAEGTVGSTSIYCSANIYDGARNLVKSIDRSAGLSAFSISTGNSFELKYSVSDLPDGNYHLELLGGDYAGDVKLYR